MKNYEKIRNEYRKLRTVIRLFSMPSFGGEADLWSVSPCSRPLSPLLLPCLSSKRAFCSFRDQFGQADWGPRGKRVRSTILLRGWSGADGPPVTSSNLRQKTLRRGPTTGSGTSWFGPATCWTRVTGCARRGLASGGKKGLVHPGRVATGQISWFHPRLFFDKAPRSSLQLP